MGYLEIAQSKMGHTAQYPGDVESSASSIAQDAEIQTLLLASIAESLEVIAERAKALS